MMMVAPSMAQQLQAGDLTTLSDQVMQQLSATNTGITAWQTHPYRHSYGQRSVVWQSGSTRIFEYDAGQSGRPVLVIPSLINSAEILDIGGGRSFITALCAQGLRPFLLDWQTPGPEESQYGTADYITKRLMPALAFMRGHTGANPVLIGHCVGGTLAAAAAQIDGNIAALITLGAPWEFPRRDGVAGQMQQADPVATSQLLNHLAEPDATLHGGFFQFLFAMLNPAQMGQRFAHFAEMPEQRPEAAHFVAIQDWLNTGPPVALPAAREMLVDWHQKNQITLGGWQVGSTAIDARAINVPTLCICGRIDSVTPPNSALPLGQSIPGASILTPDTGHISMLVGAQMEQQCVEPLARFLQMVT